MLNALDLPLAHPLTQPFQLPVSPLVAAWATSALLFAVALAWPTWSDRRATPAERPVESWAGSLSRPQWLARAGSVLLLVVAIAAGRLGTNDELENLAPALVVGAGWPALVLASVALGPVWRWIDPWDTVARLVTRGESEQEAESVWPAALVAVPWVWYLGAYTDTLEPRSVGAILALYTVFTVAGCLAVGRQRWLGTAEPLGILLSWLALLPRRRLAAWNPPRGAGALLGVMAGGVLFGAARRSELWGDLNTADHALLLATIGLIVSCAAGAVLFLWMAAVTRGGARQAGARSAVPAVAGIIVAVAMDRNRLSTSIQLLPGLLGDPFGRGWDLLGEAGAGLDPAPFGVKGLLYAQLALLLVGQLTGAVVLANRLAPRARIPVAAGLAVLAHASVIAIVSH